MGTQFPRTSRCQATPRSSIARSPGCALSSVVSQNPIDESITDRVASRFSSTSEFELVGMAWKCPACGSDIRHTEDTPFAGVVYRCHVCRLELILDTTTNRLIVAPLPPEGAATGQGV